MERRRSTGPVKKKMPATAARPEAPPQPMRTMLKVKVEITKLGGRSVSGVRGGVEKGDGESVPEETEGDGVGVAGGMVGCVRDLGREVQALELLRAEGDVGCSMCEEGFVIDCIGGVGLGGGRHGEMRQDD